MTCVLLRHKLTVSIWIFLDSVPHNELLMKLWSVGITDKLWIWFQSYLSNCTQIVSINNCLSDPLPIKSGIPQGSILDPLLFVIYIKDILSSIIYSNFFKFADDVKCYKAIHYPYDSQSRAVGSNLKVGRPSTVS